MSKQKFIDYITTRFAPPTLADLEKYIPIIERAVLFNDSTLKRHLVITSDQLNFEKQARQAGRDRLKYLVDGIHTNNPYQYRDRFQSDALRRRPGKFGNLGNLQFVEPAFTHFLNWLNRSGYRYVSQQSDFAGVTADVMVNYHLQAGIAANVLYNPVESIGNCLNVAAGFGMILACLGVPLSAFEYALIKPVQGLEEPYFAYIGRKAQGSGAIFYETSVRNRHEYRSRVMVADRDTFQAAPPNEVDTPFDNHWVIKAKAHLWDGNYACRYDEPSQVCEAYSSELLRGTFIQPPLQVSWLSPLGDSGENFVCLEGAGGVLRAEIERVTGGDEGCAYILVKPNAPGCHVDVPFEQGSKTVPLRLAREWGFVVPTGWEGADRQSEEFVKNAIATAIDGYRNDTSFWNSKSSETDAFLKSAVKWIGDKEARCQKVKSKFFANDNLSTVVELPSHHIYKNLYHVLGFDPIRGGAVPNVIGRRLRGFLLNAFKVPAQIQALVGA
jgi:hypothetical protein